MTPEQLTLSHIVRCQILKECLELKLCPECKIPPVYRSIYNGDEGIVECPDCKLHTGWRRARTDEFDWETDYSELTKCIAITAWENGEVGHAIY